MTIRMIALIALVVSATAAQSGSNKMTLPEIAEKSGGRPVVVGSAPHTPELTLDQLSTYADLVVVGKLVNPRSYLTQDQTDVYTDYQLQLTTAVVDSASTSSARQVGQLPPVTVTLHGGTLLVNGVSITVRDQSPTKWKENADLLLFLKRSESKDKQNNFILVGSAAGVYEVTAAGLKSLLSSSRRHAEIDGASVDQVAQRVKAVVAAQAVKK